MAYIPELLGLEETLATSYNLANGATTFSSSDISAYNKFSLQFTCTGFKGQTDIRLEQSLDGASWDIIENSEISLTASNCEITLQQQNWISKYLRVNLLNTSTGTINIYLLAKK
jgi:hypothetical protein